MMSGFCALVFFLVEGWQGESGGPCGYVTTNHGCRYVVIGISKPGLITRAHFLAGTLIVLNSWQGSLRKPRAFH